MARYQKVFPMMDHQANTFNQIHQYMTAQGFKYEPENGQPAFRKGDGFWAASRHLTVTYYGNFVRVDAWIDSMGAEMGLEGFYGWAVKGPLKKNVQQVEAILSRPGVGFVPQQAPVNPAPNPAFNPAPNPAFNPAANPAAPVQNGSFCPKCGAPLQPGGKFCPKCGNVLGAPAIPASGPVIPPGTTKKEYFKHYAGESFKRAVRNAAIIGYVCAGLNAVICLFLNPFGMVDSLIFLGLILGMHLGKSKGCAIGVLVYAIISVIIGLVLTGTFGGWLWIVTGISSYLAFKNAEKRFAEQTGC